MVRRTVLRLLGLVLIVGFMLTAEPGFAQKKSPTPKKSTMTDASGRTHVRPVARISDAQRKAAARRRQAAIDKRSPHGRKGWGRK
jgi:hypothetical protein